MADESSSELFKEFEEFLIAKRSKETEDAEKEDFEVEIFDGEKGVRTRRSHAKPFLQSLGIDLDPEETDGSTADQSGDAGKGDGKTAGKSGGKTANAKGSASVTRKYFIKQTQGK